MFTAQDDWFRHALLPELFSLQRCGPTLGMDTLSRFSILLRRLVPPRPSAETCCKRRQSRSPALVCDKQAFSTHIIPTAGSNLRVAKLRTCATSLPDPYLEIAHSSVAKTGQLRIPIFLCRLGHFEKIDVGTDFEKTVSNTGAFKCVEHGIPTRGSLLGRAKMTKPPTCGH